MGYVGLSLAILLAQHNEVIATDIIKEKVDMIKARISPIVDHEIENFLTTKNSILRRLQIFMKHTNMRNLW